MIPSRGSMWAAGAWAMGAGAAEPPRHLIRPRTPKLEPH